MRLTFLLFSVVCALSLVSVGACSSAPPVAGGGSRWADALTPYKVEVVQGNVVTQEQAALIQPGMTRNEVRNILGSPLLADVFHAQRWDYVFSIRRQGAASKQINVTVRFEGDRVSRFDAAALPSEAEFVASIATAKAGKVPQLALDPTQIEALPVPSLVAASKPSGPLRTYPPLEASATP